MLFSTCMYVIFEMQLCVCVFVCVQLTFLSAGVAHFIDKREPCLVYL